jgi:iron(III) transport system substrate-binding protein
MIPRDKREAFARRACSNNKNDRREDAMKHRTPSRRDILKGSTALALGAVFAAPARAEAPPAEAITPQLIEAAKKEGKVVWYTAVDLSVAEKIAGAFKEKFSGIEVRVERTGAERVFQRIGQEYASNVHAVDVANSSDASHLLTWKAQGLLLPYVPEDVAKYYKPKHRDADGTYAGFRATLSPIAYNTQQVKAEDAPTSFKDLLDPKWKGKIVKAHPGYSGTILTATFEMARDIGWDFYENLAKQNIMQVQSATDPPKKLSLGERAVMADGTEYNVLLLKEAGQPVEPVYPTEGTPFIIGPNGIFKAAPNPNAAKLFQNYCFTPEAQAIIIEVGGLRSLHAQVKEKPGRKPLADIKLMKEDAESAEKQSEAIKARYQKLFHV